MYYKKNYEKNTYFLAPSAKKNENNYLIYECVNKNTI